MDHELLTAARSTRSGPIKLANGGIFLHADRRRHCAVRPRSLASELHFSLRFHHELPHFHGACEYPPFPPRWSALEVARFARCLALDRSWLRSTIRPAASSCE